jgi:branched-chain amino acid transport system permease protein
MRVLNFAHGILFMAGAYVCQFLFAQIFGSYLFAIVVSMVVLALAGMLVERLVFRKLRENIDMQIVASLGLILLGQNGVIAIFGPSALQMNVPALQGGIHLGPIGVSFQHLLILATVTVASVALHFFLTRTKTGTAMRATSQSVEAARIVGIDPDRIFLLTFALASALAALGGALLGPLFLIFPQMGDLPLLKALTAIVLGGMGSVAGAMLGGLAIGVLEAESTLFAPRSHRLRRPDYDAAGPASRHVRRAGPGRGMNVQVFTTVALLIAGAFVPVFFSDQPYVLQTVTLALAMVIPAVGLNLVFGYTGLISLGHMGFAGVGGYAAALLMTQAWSGCSPDCRACGCAAISSSS